MQTSKSEDKVLWDKWIATRDPHVGDSLVRMYLPLVYYQVQRIGMSVPKNVSRDELKSFGLIGLYDALQKFDTSRNLKFDTYASFRIRGAIIDGLRKEDWLPRTARDKVKKIEATVEKLEQTYSRNITACDIAQELEMSEDDVHSSIVDMLYANVLSIDDIQRDTSIAESTKYHIKDDYVLMPEEHLMKEELLNDLSVSIEMLNEQEQIVISLFYKEELTFTEIGQILSISTSRVSQIHAKAIFKLREKLTKIIK
ncbi:FliA/WhiG family RNA polymerase sigma factor [Priestia taiwanensis]|uniref:FliA/WhiG family RNA polymerase sigma factor n=1 Tax=Priestia taiwanensis TaxID=1347902 RepID=UPI00166F2255|nr:FliA/WhiG family RNA polymerase sigma factor [Priestia taiwanensis]